MVNDKALGWAKIKLSKARILDLRSTSLSLLTALTATGVQLIDKTENFTSMIESMDTQRVIVIDQNIFSRTDGAVAKSMVTRTLTLILSDSIT